MSVPLGRSGREDEVEVERNPPVTDEDDGLNQGSVLNFVTVNRRVRFEVSLTAADRLRLKISSELLAVAVRVRGAPRHSARSERPGEKAT